MGEYQYYEFLAVDRPLTAAEQAEVRKLSTRARITATSFTNEYHWGDFKGSPDQLMQHCYDAHLYFANWGTHRIMLRLPRTLLDPEIAGQYCVDGQVRMSTTREHVILDLTSEDEAGEWVEDTEESLSAIVGARSELAAGDLRPLYLAGLSGYGVWERDEDAFGEEDEDEMEPQVPAGLGSLTAPKRALADFLRLDSDLLEVAAETNAALPTVTGDARALVRHIAKLPVSDKNRLLALVAEDQAARARMELLRASAQILINSATPVPGGPSPNSWTLPGHVACSAGGERVSRLPRSTPCGNNSGLESGKGAWTNWPTPLRPPGPATPISLTVPENQRLAGLRSQSSVSGASGGPVSIQAWIA
jgi:hypothetical protein